LDQNDYLQAQTLHPSDLKNPSIFIFNPFFKFLVKKPFLKFKIIHSILKEILILK